ncbi:hypothetical protein MRB53_007738 [Persea americana]|uniref:Uncharacterized protein n=1 Tax=Persea americana TaxID=3435 RepID=A0ACC2MK36_PERAE|nr:hypothetical protein MRB53_007738 [Persea americana]
MLETFEVGPCQEAYQMGFLIGERFSTVIRSRVATDLILQHQLLPFAHTTQGQTLIQQLTSSNRKRFPSYWDEMLGTAEGSGASFLHILLLNFRREILPFLPKTKLSTSITTSDDCSDVLIVNDTMAIAVHNEDANIALINHVYLIKATLPNGLSFTAYTYAGELPSCAFGFNSHGLAFTLDAVPPLEEEIAAGGIGRNFISRDLLEANGLSDALNRIYSSDVSVGHSYNLVDVKNRKIVNVETASGNRVSVHEIGETTFFHANMYLHLLQVKQVHDESSLSRQRRAAQLPKQSKEEILSLLGDSADEKYPIYMQGPTLYTLCTALIDLDKQTLSIYQGNPSKKVVSHVLPIL